MTLPVRSASVFSATFDRSRLLRLVRARRVAVRGFFYFRHERRGQVLYEGGGPNLIVDTGVAGLAGLAILTGQTDPFAYVGIGEGTTAVDPSDTALESEISSGGGERALATLSRVTDTITNDSARMVKTFTFTDSFAVTEAGVFDADTAGVMLCRQTRTAINVVATDTLQVTYTVIFIPN